MTTLREAAKQALEALEAGPDVDPIFAGETEDALRAALAEPVQEPMAALLRAAGRVLQAFDDGYLEPGLETLQGGLAVDALRKAWGAFAPARIQGEQALQVRAALRERLAQPEQEHIIDCPRCGHCCPQQPVQEPVAWMDREGDLYKMPEIEGWAPPHTMLYAHPPQRKPLTDEQIAVLNFMLGADDLEGVWFGERHPKENGAFWWRNRLRNAFQDAAIETKLREKNA